MVRNLQNFIDRQLILVVVGLLRTVIYVFGNVEVERLVDWVLLLTISAISNEMMI